MPAPQGLATFPGVTQILSAVMTLSHGTSPSMCTIRTVPQQNLSASIGDLVFSFGGSTITFPDCALDNASLQVSDTHTWTLSILDRRWKWRYGVISGSYNHRKADGMVESATEKTPRELASLLLDAMGEQNYDVSRLPNNSRPEVHWSMVNPARQLAELCSRFSCRVVLGTDNRVSLWPTGVGADLPVRPSVTTLSYSLTGRIAPDLLKVVTAPVLFQSKLALEAVGEETDGRIKLIDDLSYMPDGGWGEENPYGFHNVYEQFGNDAGEIAKRSVFRMYRIKEQVQGGLSVPGYPGVVNSIDQYHLRSLKAEAAIDASGIERAMPATVEGSYWTRAQAPLLRQAGNTAPHTPYAGSFSVDAERRIVIFSEPLVRVAEGANEAAILTLTTSYTVTSVNRVTARLEIDRNLPGNNGTGPMLLRHEEIQPQLIQYYEKDRPTRRITNAREVRREANHWLDAAASQFAQSPAGQLTYAGLENITLDGAVQQVRYSCGPKGMFTSASVNQEHDIFTPSYEERLRRERAAELAARRAAALVIGFPGRLALEYL